MNCGDILRDCGRDVLMNCVGYTEGLCERRTDELCGIY